MYEVALSLLKKINEFGYEAYIVGGYPRDQYLGHPSTDIDICTSMLPNQMINNFHIIENRSQYGSLIIEEKGFLFEITTYRRDYYDNNRYPEIEFVDTLEEDLQRRDFIMNTLCINSSGQYVDRLGAIKDIQNKTIRMIGTPSERLKQDPLRMIRAIRFASDLDFEIEENLRESIKQNRQLLHTLSASRIQKELAKVYNLEKWDEWIETLDLKDYLP